MHVQCQMAKSPIESFNDTTQPTYACLYLSGEDMIMLG